MLLHIPLLDMFPGGFDYLFEIIGWYAVVALFFAIVVVEAIVLWLMKWSDFWTSVLGSLLANLGSMIVGLMLSDALAWNVGVRVFDREFITILLGGLAFSIVIEGLILFILQRAENRTTFFAVITANLASYFLNGLILAITLDAY